MFIWGQTERGEIGNKVTFLHIYLKSISFNEFMVPQRLHFYGLTTFGDYDKLNVLTVWRYSYCDFLLPRFLCIKLFNNNHQ